MFMGIEEPAPGPVKKKKEDKPKEVNSPKEKTTDSGTLTRKPTKLLFINSDKF